MRHRLEILGAAFLFSTGGAAIKATSLTSWQVAGFRSLVAAVAVLLVIPNSRRNWSWPAAAVGLAYALTLVLFVAANKLTTSANSIFLQSTAPLYLLVLSPLLLKEPVRRAEVLLMSLVACGLLCIFAGHEPATTTAPRPVAGNIAALLAGLTYGFAIAGLRWISARSAARDATMPTVAIGNIMAFLICLPAVFPLPLEMGPPAMINLAAVIYLGVFQIGLAYYLLGAGVQRVSALEAGMLLLLEPALNPLWTWLLHGERPGALALCGGGLILAASALRTCLTDPRPLDSLVPASMPARRNP